MNLSQPAKNEHKRGFAVLCMRVATSQKRLELLILGIVVEEGIGIGLEWPVVIL